MFSIRAFSRQVLFLAILFCSFTKESDAAVAFNDQQLNPCTDSDTLTIMLNGTDLVYYYYGLLRVNELKNNFHGTSVQGAYDRIRVFESDAKAGNRGLLLIVKTSASINLTTGESKLVAFLNEKKYVKYAEISAYEMQLIKASEEMPGKH